MGENITNTVSDHVNKTSENWISQINAGGITYDIATHHEITFKDGKNDTTGVTWNGLSDLEIIIPNITDIVQTPIEFAGTVSVDDNGDGVISWNTGHGPEAEVGNLLFIINDCMFESHACEAGDMAIYSGSAQDEGWKIVSGENQVNIVAPADDTTGDNVNKHTVKVGAAKDILTVEGKTLALTLDYGDLNDNHLSVAKTGSKTAQVAFTNVKVGSKLIDVIKGNDKPTTIGKEENIQKATNLKDGNVTFAGIETLMTGFDGGDFDAGEFPKIKKNETDVTFDVTGGSLDINTDGQDFVTSVSLPDVTFESVDSEELDASENSGAFALVGGIEPGEGQLFVTGVNGNSENFIVAGCLQPDGDTYVKGIDGDYVSSVTPGSFTFNENYTDVVVDFIDEDESDFDEDNVLLSSVDVEVNNDTSVLATATVSSHVLSFTPVDVASGVTVNKKYKSIKKVGYDYTSAVGNTTSFSIGNFTKSSDVTYTLNTAKETVYTTTSSYYKINTPSLEINMGGYNLNRTDMVATATSGTFGVSLTSGTLPSFSAITAVKNAVVTASVSTELEYTDVTINVVDPSAMSINLPGDYTLTTVTSGGIEVGVAGELDKKIASVDLSNFVTDVTIVESKSTSTEPTE